MELLKKLENREPLRVFYDNQDFGVFKYDSNRKAYQGEIGYLELEVMLKAIKYSNYFIQVGEV